MPSRESVSEEIRARTEFATAVRQGIDALMGRCGYSRERATLALLKELNRGNGPESKPTDDEVCISLIYRDEGLLKGRLFCLLTCNSLQSYFFDAYLQTFKTMRRYKLGLDEANRAIIVSRAMRRELLNAKQTNVSPMVAIQRLTSRLSLDNILYESGEDDSDDDGQSEILPLKIPNISRVSSSASINRSSSSSSNSTTNTTLPTHSTSSSRKHARSKKNSSPSPRKQMKASLIRNNSSSTANTSNTIIVGRKRSMDEMDATNKNSGVETKAASGRPQLRAPKRLHRSSTSTEASVASTK